MSETTPEIPASPAADASPTRERLLETARELFHAQGFTATGLAQILRQAGVGSGSLYHFFRMRTNALTMVLEGEVNELLTTWFMESGPSGEASEEKSHAG